MESTVEKMNFYGFNFKDKAFEDFNYYLLKIKIFEDCNC